MGCRIFVLKNVKCIVSTCCVLNVYEIVFLNFFLLCEEGGSRSYQTDTNKQKLNKRFAFENDYLHVVECICFVEKCT